MVQLFLNENIEKLKNLFKNFFIICLSIKKITKISLDTNFGIKT